MSTQWETPFIAVSVVLGEPLDALDESALANARGLVDSLRSASREARARALARALTQVAVAIEAMRLA